MVNFFFSFFIQSALPEIIAGYAGSSGTEHLGIAGAGYRPDALPVPNQQYTGATYLRLTSKH